MPTGLGIVDGLLSPKPVVTALRVVLVLLAIGAGYMTFRTAISVPRPCGRDGSRPRMAAVLLALAAPGEPGRYPPPGAGVPRVGYGAAWVAG